MKRMNTLFEQSKFTVLLASLSIMLFGQLFTPIGYAEFFRFLFNVQFIIVGLSLFLQFSKRWLWVILLTASLSCMEYLSENFHYRWIEFVSGTIYILSLLFVSYKVFKHIFMETNVDMQMILAVCSGYIMIGLISSLLFLFIELAQPNSFKLAVEGGNLYQEFQYFGFITTLTVGYGDIVPLSATAKKVSVLMALIGQFYTLIVMGIVIGKFIGNRR